MKEFVSDENIVVDKASGKNTEREGYQALKGIFGLREGDTLYVTSLDRLSRNKEDIKRELQWFKEKKVRLKILDLPTSLVEVPQGQQWILEMIQNVLIEVLSSIAEQERLTIRKRQKFKSREIVARCMCLMPCKSHCNSKTSTLWHTRFHIGYSVP